MFNSHWHNSSTVTGTNFQQSLARLFSSHWHGCSVTGTVVQQSLARLINSHRHDSLTVTDMVLQELLAWFFNSHWQDYSAVPGTIRQQLLTPLFNNLWHDCPTAMGKILQQWLARFFYSRWHHCSTVPGTTVQQILAWLFNIHGQYFFFFLCWQNSELVIFTVEESCHVPGIWHLIPLISFRHESVTIWLGLVVSFSRWSFISPWTMTFTSFPSSVRINFLNFTGVSSPKIFPKFTSGLRLKLVIEVCLVF